MTAYGWTLRRFAIHALVAVEGAEVEAVVAKKTYQIKDLVWDGNTAYVFCGCYTIYAENEEWKLSFEYYNTDDGDLFYSSVGETIEDWKIIAQEDWENKLKEGLEEVNE